MEERIYDLLEAKFAEEEFSDCFLIDLKLHGNHKLDIFLDSDTGITFDRCRRISRYLEAHIDEAGWMGEKYVLEVSSPGVGRPLKLPRQYPKHVGRKLHLVLKDGTEMEGELIDVQADNITIERKVVEKQGKKKKRRKVATEIPFDAIGEATVKVSFK